MRIAIRIRAAAPHLLVHPPHHADRALRLEPELLDQPHRLPRGHESAAVVHRALTDIPRVDVAAEHDDLVWMLASAHLGHDVARVRIGEHVRLHRERHANGLTAILDAMQHVRILERDRGRRHVVRLGGRVAVAHRARVRCAQRVRRHRAHERRNRAVRRRRICAGEAIDHGLAVCVEGRLVRIEVVVEEHDLSLRLRRVRVQIREVVHHQNIGRDPARWGADAAAEAEHVERAAMRREQHRGFAAAHPVRHHHRLAVHVVEAVLLHLREDPVDRALETLRADGAIAEGVDELREPVPGGAVLERAIDELVGRGLCTKWRGQERDRAGERSDSRGECGHVRRERKNVRAATFQTMAVRARWKC